MNARNLAAKVEWEGGIFEALSYGIRSTDIEDEELADLWAELEDHWEAMQETFNKVQAILDDAL